jgi:3'-phosphoadenosine 5'-phosphosulfate sulfotransferase (PAPS reductase)/FAD synthetase
MQFCTVELKIKPALTWLDLNDPECQATCLVGVRRAESVNRRNFPERIESSANHGGRPLWAPLVDLSNEQRDELLARAGYEPLPHRSMECFPCINSNRRDLRVLADDPDRIAKIERIEDEMGTTKKGKPRTMFRPYHYMGATGIRQVVQWAEAERGKFTLDDGTGEECETGYCGT